MNKPSVGQVTAADYRRDPLNPHSLCSSAAPLVTESPVMGEKREIEAIHSWSAPRSLSTSLKYSFSQRDDMEVLDEPLYANCLRLTGIQRPYPDEVLSETVCMMKEDHVHSL
ncbi:hypothetical protein RJ641_023606 [Dillenia turbinata]|uniref:Uncharacterized protein n=1 Tax=Dillenia turbinata TaxID=194707 RepID=A0AAN8U795_9MAGN